MNPGVLKTPINFFRNESFFDDEGYKVSKFVKIHSTKCYISKNTFDDRLKSNSKSFDSSKITIKCIIRYNKKLDDRCFAEINGVMYRIKEFDNLNMRNKEIRLVLQDGV